MILGFDTAVFAMAAILAMIVIYDATGVRRESGKQAVLINSIIEEFIKRENPSPRKTEGSPWPYTRRGVTGNPSGIIDRFSDRFFWFKNLRLI